MSIMEYNGGTVVAMAGKECVCIGSDLRLGEQMKTLATNVKKVHKMGDRLMIGMAGFHSDNLTIVNRINFRKTMYELREGRPVKPAVLSQMLSNLLYERRFGPYFCEPVVAGLDPVTFKPSVYGMDLIGCLSNPRDFVMVGGAEEEMLGAAEAYWREDMNPDDLFECTAQVLLAGLERAAGCGWGAVVYTITKDKVNAKTIKTRMD